MTIYDWEVIRSVHPDAKYAAMDSNGEVYSYTDVPRIMEGGHVWSTGKFGEAEGPYTGAVFAGDRPLNAEESLEAYGTVNKKIGVTCADRRYEMASRTMTTLMTIYPDEPYTNLAETAVKIADILLNELEKNNGNR